MPQKMRLVSLFIAAVFAVFPSLAFAENPDLQACLKECGSRIQKCTQDMNSVKEEIKTDCADIEACRRLDLSVEDGEALKGFCLATCQASASCANSAIPSIRASVPTPSVQKPPPRDVSKPRPVASLSPEQACRASGGAWVEKWDTVGLRYECMTVGRFHVRVKELEERKSGDPEAVKRIEAEIGRLKAAVASVGIANANDPRFDAMEDILKIERDGDAIRSQRLDEHAKALKHHTEQINDLEVEEGHGVIGVDAGGYAWVGTQMPYGRARPGAGVMIRARGRLGNDWDLGAGGNLCYSGEDPSGATLKCVGGELSLKYRVEDYFAIRFGVDTEWRLNPKNRAESSSHGPLFGVSFTPGLDEWRALVELNGGVKATVVPEMVDAGLALHAIPDAVFNIAIGVQYN